MEWTTVAIEPVYEEVIDGWVVTWMFSEENGCRVVRSVTIRPESDATPPGGIDSKFLRKLSPNRVIARSHSQHPRNVPG